MRSTNFNGTINQSDIIVNGSANKLANAPDNKVQLLATKHGWGSAWWDESVDLSKDWSSEFLVNAFNGSGTSDGFTFAINGDPKGTNSLGDGGQNLGFFGYDTKGGVKNSYAVLFDMWTTGPVSLLGFSKSDASTIPSASINLPIGLANNSYAVQISYSASRKVLSASVGGNTYEQSVDLQSVVGNSGYIGFTAANGGGTIDTDISNWTANASKFGNTSIIRGNSLYTIVDGPSWTQAETNSVKLGGHLASISSDSENKFLVAQYAVNSSGYSGDVSYYLGLTDKASKGNWVWSDGSSLSYSNWSPGEPQQSNGEDYSEFLLVSTGPRTPGQWGDNFETIGSGKGIAEASFIRRGDSAYVFVQGPTWEEAEANAVKLGGHLVTINDSEENDWISAAFGGNTLSDISGGFIGLKELEEGNWKWVDGSTSGYRHWFYDTNTPWNPQEPNNYGGKNEQYGIIYFHSNPGNTGGTIPPLGWWADGMTNSAIYGITEIKLAPNSTPTGTPNLSGTFKSGQIISIDKTPIQDADNFTGYTPDYNYSFEVSNDNGTTWTKLTTTDATDNTTTYTLTTEEVGKKVRGVVSYLDGYGTNESVASLGSSVTSAAVVRGNSLYEIVDGPSWTQAKANAVKLGGHLVTINDESENSFITSSFSNQISDLAFIGNNDIVTEGVWRLPSGESQIYANWANGEPNDGNSAKNEDVAVIYFRTQDFGTVGVWNDVRIDGYGNISKGIAETPFIRRGDSAYVIVQGPTWEEAEANAVKLGGHLVTINDAEENEWITKEFSKPDYYYDGDSLSSDPVTFTHFWLGAKLSKAQGIWSWLDGSSYGFDLYPPTVDNFENLFLRTVFNLPPSFSNYTGKTGFWWNGVANDISYQGGGILGYKGIAEIKLAPNNDPTGTPTLSGTTKVGQVITIDRTAIEDSDNFTGYTSTYNYSFEVSSDNGTTWTKLTSTDATDNNSTYILTTAEVGKKVRGVVSYLDGYGTQESVPSTASAPITSSAPPVQSLSLTPPSKTAIRSGVSITSAIAYNVSTGDTALTGIGASLYFDSTQLTVNTTGDPFKTGLLGNAITADTTNVDGDPKTDKILALTYADFGGNFPGTGTTLPLTLANLNLVPTSTYSGTTLHLQGTPAVGYTATGADLTLGFNAAPTVTATITNKTINRGSAFTYTVPSGLFTDPDSTLSISAKTATGAALPAWLTFNATTGTFTGTPTSGGIFNLAVAAADELGSVSAPLTLNVREVQSVSSSAADIRYQRNKEVTVPINYSTTDGSQTTGMSFKVHFNSSLFSFDPVTGVSNKATADLFQIGAVQFDTSNTDGDTSTDKFIPINVASFSGSFPSGTTPIKLADLIFKAADKAIDPLTGLMDTKINFSQTEAAQGYGFQATAASLKPMSFSLDVDGDGKVTALGDGLMVIRKLFGAAFAGDALTSKAISPNANRTTAEIHDFIQQGIDAGYLDVDKDAKITALGDGLMVIRQLFGAAFAGDALTNKAISTSSPYFGQSNAFSWISGNIEAMRMPTI